MSRATSPSSGERYGVVRVDVEDQVSPGDRVYALGTPLRRQLANTVTEGIISAIRGQPLAGQIQFSAIIYPGNSGGPLVDDGGSVVAMLTSVATRDQYSDESAPGIGFGLPASVLWRQAQQILTAGSIACVQCGFATVVEDYCDNCGCDRAGNFIAYGDGSLKCRNCGRRGEGADEYCGHCGTDFDHATTEPEE